MTSSRRVDPLALARAVRDSDLSCGLKALAWALGTRADGDGSCFPSLDTLADDTGLSRATVSRAVKELRALGLLTWTATRDRHGGLASNRYRLAPCPGPAWDARRLPTRTQERPGSALAVAAPVRPSQELVLRALLPVWRSLRGTDAQDIAPADRRPLLALWRALDRPDPGALADDLALVLAWARSAPDAGAHRERAHDLGALVQIGTWGDRLARARSWSCAAPDTAAPAAAPGGLSDVQAWAHVLRVCSAWSEHAANADPDRFRELLLGKLTSWQDEALAIAGGAQAVWSARADQHPAALPTLRRTFIEGCTAARIPLES